MNWQLKALNVFPPFLPIPVMLKYLESDSGSEGVYWDTAEVYEQGFDVRGSKDGNGAAGSRVLCRLIREALSG